MTTIRILLPVLSAVIASTQPALGQPGGPHPHGHDGKKPSPEKMVGKLDSDGDGLISFEEFQMPDKRRRGDRLAEADADGDGNISRAEMEAQMDSHLEAMRARAEARFTQADLNSDGFITTEERKQVAFEMLDTNGDGYLAPEELAAAQKRDRRPRD
ncbi:MAG: hypothetical protein VW202_10395 [Halieaceae bacterium]|jgi:Ca2+-binding EF-hand superfamily protein